MSSPKRPNIVMFMPDQLRADALGAYGNAIAKTPNIDAFAARSALFEQAFVQHSVCAPSRTSMFSGTYPQTRGHRTLTHLLAEDEFNVFRALKDSGYHVAWTAPRGHTFAPGVGELSVSEYGFITPPTTELFDFGKYQDRAADPDVWSRLFYWGKREGSPTLDYDEAAVQSAERWLEYPPEEPWVLFLPLIFPHCPFTVEEPWFSLHDRASMPRPKQKRSGPEPEFIEAIRREYGIGEVSVETWREVAAVYHGMVSRIDSQFGRILQAIEGKDDTVVLFFADHGEYLGDYGLIEKWPAGLDEVLLRVPLIIGGAQATATRHDALVEMLDLTPTLLDLAQTDAGGAQHFGRSLLPLLQGHTTEHREVVFSEGGFRVEEEPLFETPPFPYDLKGKVQHDRPTAVGRAYAIRTRDWAFIYRVYDTDELYDRQADPDELNNLVELEEYADIAGQMRAKLLETLATTNDLIAREDPPAAQFALDLPSPASQLAARRLAAERAQRQ